MKNLACNVCDRLPTTREEAFQMLDTGLCENCEGEARVKGWKPSEGLSGALSAINSCAHEQKQD